MCTLTLSIRPEMGPSGEVLLQIGCTATERVQKARSRIILAFSSHQAQSCTDFFTILLKTMFTLDREITSQSSPFAELQLAEDMSTKSAKNKPAGNPPPLISDKKLKQLYTTMLKCRILDAHARSLGGGSSLKGLEAAAVGAAIDLQAEDTIVFSSGTAVANFLKGAPLRSIFQSLKSSSTGTKKRRKNVVSAGAQAQGALATGVAYAQSAGNNENVTIAFLSERPEEGEAGRDALQFALAHKLPIVYVYNRELLDMAKMHSYGFPMIPVDGSDVVAVYRVAHECTKRARIGGGPSVIAYSFVSSNGSGARSQDPLRSMERYLLAKNLDMTERKHSIIRSFEQEIAHAVSAARKPLQPRETKHESRHVFSV